MNAMLRHALQILSMRFGWPRNLIAESCPPDCWTENKCVNHRAYRRTCCDQPDCTQACDDWVDVGSC